MHVVLDHLRGVVMGRQCMPVGDEKQALIFVLQVQPVFQHTVVVAQMKAPGGAHAGENTVGVHGGERWAVSGKG